MNTNKKGKTREEIEAARAAAAEKRRALLAAEKSLDAVKRSEVLAAAGVIRTTDGAGLSPKNQVLVYLQASAAGFSPSLVGGFKQWRDNGRIVKRGARGLLICFPKMGKNEETGADEVAGFGWGYVFDISQTIEKGTEETDREESEEEKSEREAVEAVPVERVEAVREAVTQAAAGAGAGGGALADIMAAIAAA